MATSPLQSEKKPQDAAYARAQDAIATARTSDASDLTLSGDDFSDLTELPPDIGTLTALTDLSLSGTQVSDLSPVLPLTQLADAPQSAGLAFKNTVAAQADPRIAEIAGIDDNAKRATDLFAYLKNVNLTQTAQYHTLLSTRLMRGLCIFMRKSNRAFRRLMMRAMRLWCGLKPHRAACVWALCCLRTPRRPLAW